MGRGYLLSFKVKTKLSVYRVRLQEDRDDQRVNKPNNSKRSYWAR